jgi:sulfur relay (sulfurtransferase) complex TusBCD TusD component (DsrE family)
MVGDEKADLMLFLTAAPYGSDTVSTALRLLDAVLAKGASVQVWTCGYATMLTQSALGDTKPANFRALGRRYPTAASLVRSLITAYAPHLTWYACRFCTEERGAAAHIAEVRVRSPLRLRSVIDSCTKVVYIGGA